MVAMWRTRPSCEYFLGSGDVEHPSSNPLKQQEYCAEPAGYAAMAEHDASKNSCIQTASLSLEEEVKEVGVAATRTHS